jgi:hypothetical protein
MDVFALWMVYCENFPSCDTCMVQNGGFLGLRLQAKRCHCKWEGHRSASVALFKSIDTRFIEGFF